MEDAVLSPNTMLGVSPDSAMDIDFMNDLLLEGCWLETMNGSEFLQQGPSSFNALFDPPFQWPVLENNECDSGASTLNGNDQQVMQNKPLLLRDSALEEGQAKPLDSTQSPSVLECSSPSDRNLNEGSDSRRRCWIGPRGSFGSTTSVMDRLIQALGRIQDLTKDKDVLIQIWVPVSRGGKRVLTTNNQPFSLNPSSRGLSKYRDISVNYQFSAEEDSTELVGLPSRVFLKKVPEWTPDVRFFGSDEYPRVDHAQQYNVRGTLALPVFEQGSRTCLGVIEVVTTTQKVKYRPEIECVCKALEAVDLRSSEVCGNHNVQSAPRSYEAAIPEIQEVLRSACKTHGLPLAQTWVLCIQQGKGGCRHSDENYQHCVSTVDHACHVADPRVQAFHEACSEHHLLKGQGIAGRAYLTNQPCFSSDITSFARTEYPLSHHARMFGLRAAVAIRLRCIHTGTVDFVLEFFLPVECKDHEEQKEMLSSLSVTIQRVCQNLRVVTDKELEEESVLPVVSAPSDNPTDTEKLSKVETNHLERHTEEDSSQSACLEKVQPSNMIVSGTQKELPGKTVVEKSLDFGHYQDSDMEGGEGCSSYAEGSCSDAPTGKTGDRKRMKAEKTITLQVLQQYFAGSLKDAAKSLSVCPTTLKRICRQHGIKRWPSRKIKKVGHSLQKLQIVMDSVQGASGTLQIGSFYTKFPELASSNHSITSPVSNSNSCAHQKPLDAQPGVPEVGCRASASKSGSSSCSQSSSSSQCCSSGRKENPSASDVLGGGNSLVPENKVNDSPLKRTRSHMELRELGRKEEQVLPRSHSNRSFNPYMETQPQYPKFDRQVLGGTEPLRVKVTFGDEKIRFRMQENWDLKGLWRDIATRFSIDDVSMFDLKYLDDESEWVLLTCEADLEECIDVCRSSQGTTIKLLVQPSHQYHHSRLGSSLDSCRRMWVLGAS